MWKKECIAGDRIRFTVNIPNEHLKSWCELKEDGGLYSQFSYVEILNASIVENGVKIRQDCTRINGLIRRSCGEVKNKCRQLQGRTRVQYLQRLRKIAIRQKELINVRLIEERIKKIRGNAKQLLYYVSKLMWNSEPPVPSSRKRNRQNILHVLSFAAQLLVLRCKTSFFSTSY